MTSEEIRLLIIDDGEAMRRLLRMRLASLDGLGVVDEASTVSQAIQLVAERCPQVVLLGAGPGLDIADAIGKMKRECENVRVIVLARFEIDGATAMSAGASAHLLKEADVSVLADAIRQAVDE